MSAPVLRKTNFPTPGYEESLKPLGMPETLVTISNSYRFIEYQSDNATPVAYDPCRPIHFVIRPQGEPVGGEQIVMDAISRVSQATGLLFIYDGTTTETPSFQRSAYQPGRYGDHWAPVLISWVTPQENPDFAAGVAGKSGSMAMIPANGPKIYVTGIVELDAMKMTNMLRTPVN